MRFGENNVLGPKYINIYEFWRVGDGTNMVHHTFFVYYLCTKKVQEHDLYINQILYHFDSKKIFLGRIIKFL